MNVVFYTLGCKVNQYESQAAALRLSNLGYSVSFTLQKADFYVINTCSVTNEADKKSRQAIARVLKLSPDARVVVIGCSSQNDTHFFTQNESVIAVGGNEGKCEFVVNAIKQYAENQQKTCDIAPLSAKYSATDSLVEYTQKGNENSNRILEQVSGKTRGFIKIQDGCNRYCSYCRIPYLRGKSRSRDIPSILSELDELRKTHKEIVFTGVDVSAFGMDTGTSLYELFSKVAPGRIRLSSLECSVIEPKLLEVMRERGLCDHFHLSLQSGSESVLSRMNRKYTPTEYANKVQLIRQYFPSAAITTDIIVGFCGETEQEHTQTLEFVREIGFSDIHVFPFSVRKGTSAFTMGGAVDEATKNARVKDLLLLKKQLIDEFLAKNSGRCYEVLSEANGCGFTGNYIKVYINNVKRNQLVNVRLSTLYKDGFLGEIIE